MGPVDLRGSRQLAAAIANQSLDKARALRASGLSWDKVGKYFGVSGETVRRRVDPEYAEMMRQSYQRHYGLDRKKMFGNVRTAHRPPDSVLAERDNAYAEQTLDQVLTGTPPRGRSALDQRR